MDEICRNKPWVQPLAIAGSNVEAETKDVEHKEENVKEKISKRI